MRTGMLWEMPGWFPNLDAWDYIWRKKRKSERKYFGQNGEEILRKPTIFNSKKKLGICPDLSMIMINLSPKISQMETYRWDWLTTLPGPRFLLLLFPLQKSPAVISSFCSRAWWRPRSNPKTNREVKQEKTEQIA